MLFIDYASVNQQLDDEEEDDFTIDDFTDTDEEEEEKEAGGVSTYPKNMQVSNLNQKKSPKDALDPALDNSRVRKEWSTDEEEIFLKGILNCNEICPRIEIKF